MYEREHATDSRRPHGKHHQAFPGVLANDNVSLELYPGQVLALLGENGAGKSTLMNMLVGLYRPDSGTIHVRGQLAEIHSPQDSMALGIGISTRSSCW